MMNFWRIKLHSIVFYLIFIFTVFTLFTFNFSNVDADLIGTDDLRITEHRISIVQNEDADTLTVFDEFWISNRGSEPYNNIVFNTLPESIIIEDGMFCLISEKGEHTCYDWRHENNNYYWLGNYVILPKDYAKTFEFEISIQSMSNSSNLTTISKTVDSNSGQVDDLREIDSWGWVREGFYRGWTTFMNFTIENLKNNTESFEIDLLKIPPGLKIELYLDKNSNSLFEKTDTLLGFDSDYDGKMEPVPGYDFDNDDIIDVNISALENRTFLIYLRADYSIHFLTQYHKTITPSDKGIIDFKKSTLYDTSLLRFFVIPKEDTFVENDNIDFEKRVSEGSSGDTIYYYGEWSGNRDNEVTIKLKDETVNNEGSGFDFLIFVFILLLALILIIFIVIRKQRRKQSEATQLRRAKKRGVVKPRKVSAKSKTKTKATATTKIKKKKPSSDEEVTLEGMDTSKRKVAKALKRLTEDYKSGRIDEELYNELREKYEIIK
jgi:hypothetical protein